MRDDHDYKIENRRPVLFLAATVSFWNFRPAIGLTVVTQSPTRSMEQFTDVAKGIRKMVEELQIKRCGWMGKSKPAFFPALAIILRTAKSVSGPISSVTKT